MVLIQTSSIEKKDNLSVCNLNYPIIKSDNKKNIINNINQRIYEDIISFKASIEDILDMIPVKNRCLSCINTDYYISYNNNDIISIPIEFSQIDGLYNISYINSYNYDISLEKEITLEDIFDSTIDYINLIANKIENKIKELSKELSMDKYIMLLDYLKDIVLSDSPTFYIDNDGITICFSSYELDPMIYDISTFKISFDQDREYLNKYIL
ncbi:RsiV family protein [Romboutsia sp. 13368]|uniref:RsiV family protein n=1 Tax=Romboutsia sp. 13368 TaxID=2708053 RepID=UPI0025E23D7C|nr:RsiV family protein [Romboutsia sp. 13368]